MARPRVFISSTYFDLRVVRADLERFMKEMGYEPVLFERGHVAYGKDDALEEYCYREITSCDILVALVGGKFGTQAREQRQSISQKELRTAIDNGKQVYVFVERAVHAEYKTYQKNKDVEGFTPISVDDTRVFEFLEEIYGLPAGNPIEPFEISDDIIRYLREQWAGLFQRLLQESARQSEFNLIKSLQNTALTLDQLVTFLTEERTKGDDAIKDILLSSHPAFDTVKKAAEIQYRVVFYTVDELSSLLSACGYQRIRGMGNDALYWYNSRLVKGIRVAQSIFDENGKLKVVHPEDWEERYIASFSGRSRDEESYGVDSPPEPGSPTE